MKRKTIIKVLIVVVALVALSLWINSRWDAWFGNPPEPEYEAPCKISHLLMTFGETGEDSRIFTWMCGDTIAPAILQLVVVADTLHFLPESEIFKSRSGEAAYYKVEIPSLPRGIEYKYRVVHTADTTQWYSFSIPLSRNNRSFIYLGDVQDKCTGITASIFSEIFSLYPDVDFYLFGGDIIERPMMKYWDYWFSSVQEVSATTPILAVAGNHEYLKGFPPYLEERFGLTFPYAQEKNNNGNALASVKVGDAQIYILDSNKEFWNYPYQRSWLKRELKASDAKWKIVSMHHPIYSTKGAFNQLFQRIFFNPIIRNCGADLVLQGHEHTFMRTSTVAEDGTLQTPVYITSHCSPKNYKVSYTSNYSKIDNNDKYYQVIKYDSAKMTIESYNSQHILIDNIEIRQNNVFEIE